MEADRAGTAAQPRSSRWRALVVSAAVAAVLATSAGCIKKPTMKVAGVRVVGLDFEKIDLVFDMKVFNPNGFQIVLSSLSYDLIAGGITLASGRVPSPVVALAARENTVVQTPVSVDYVALAQAMGLARSGQYIPYELKTKAKFNALIVDIPLEFSRKGRMPPIRKPNWHFRDVRYVKGPPSRFDITFEIDNPNQFTIPLQRIHGVLKYGDDVVVRIDQPTLEPIPPGATANVVIPARVDGWGATKALQRSLLQRRHFKFEGELRMGVPEVLRKLFLEETAPDE